MDNNKKEKTDRRRRKGLYYELPIIREQPDFFDYRWKINVKQADEEKLVLRYTGFEFWFGLGIVALICFGAFTQIFIEDGFFVDIFVKKDFTGAYFFILYFMFFALSVPVFLHCFTPRKYWVFNRKTKMVTVPGKFFVKGYDIPFDQIRIEYRTSGSGSTGSTQTYPVVMIPDEGGVFGVFLNLIGSS
ncbi:hypothetical protein K5X82_11140 [Halosquirtibacter xylanolyticus]|uniref:hypothetical protein n=1 Tax=Halosquirtibacter xylanolyticus TaxID=3374599 RepID=UPI00374829F7|nr:hypothetical protein K5X82_11140 [Prolixibacteraceae bacterium]